jgi:hypothetical protein
VFVWYKVTHFFFFSYHFATQNSQEEENFIFVPLFSLSLQDLLLGKRISLRILHSPFLPASFTFFFFRQAVEITNKSIKSKTF